MTTIAALQDRHGGLIGAATLDERDAAIPRNVATDLFLDSIGRIDAALQL